jgi:hypothetical protein
LGLAPARLLFRVSLLNAYNNGFIQPGGGRKIRQHEMFIVRISWEKITQVFTEVEDLDIL